MSEMPKFQFSQFALFLSLLLKTINFKKVFVENNEKVLMGNSLDLDRGVHAVTGPSVFLI